MQEVVLVEDVVVVKAMVDKAVEEKASVDEDKDEEALNERSGVRNCVALSDRQRLVDPYEAGDDYLDLAQRIGINYNTVLNIIRLWSRDGRVEVQQQGGAHNVVVTAEMDSSIRDITLAEPFTTVTNIQ